MIKGSCLCEGIQYQYDGEITELAVCHCNMCKRAQGTPFVTNAPISFSAFKILTGSELLKSYYSSANEKTCVLLKLWQPDIQPEERYA